MQAAFETIAIMSQRNGRWRGEAENSPGHQDLQVCDWLRAGTFHDVQDPTSPEDLLAHKRDKYVAAADCRPLGSLREPRVSFKLVSLDTCRRSVSDGRVARASRPAS